MLSKNSDCFHQLSERRKFLTTMALGAGSLVLSACGGGADSGASDAATVNAAKRPKGGSASSPVAASSPASSTTQVTDKSFGVKGDGTTNDRIALQKAIDGSIGKILLITGASRIDAAGLDLRTNSHIQFASGASIKLLAHNTDFYQMLRVWDVQNVIVENATLDGSKELNSAKNDPQDGGYGMGISIAGSSNVTLSSPTTVNCWGDGIYISKSYEDKKTQSNNVQVTSHHANGCRRQGVTLISGTNIVFKSPLWENIGGTVPSCGLDIEPNDNTDVLEGIQIISPTTRNCNKGILVELTELPGPVSKVVTIDISQHRDENSINAGFSVSDLATNGYSVTGHIASQSPTFVHEQYAGFVSYNYDKAGPAIEVTNQTIIP